MAASTEPDVFDEPSPPIIDGDILMASKENIQPLARGRRATTLASVLATPHSQRSSYLASARSRHRLNCQLALENAEDDDDDPLEAYYRFVYWTIENYPAGQSAESGLLELLEEATRILKDDRGGKWRSHLKYLELWILYANRVEKPQIIYRFLLTNDIGTEHALFYEEFASVLERNGRRTEADEVYLLGINRKAQPLEHLQAKHRDFQKRMVLCAPSASSPPSPPRETTEAESSKRRVLGESKKPKSRAAAASSSTAASMQEDVFGTQAVTRRAAPNARMQVFVDPSGEQAAAAAPGVWTDVGTRTSRVKENVKEVSKMKGTVIKQKPSSSSRAAPGPGMSGGFTVFRDPDPSEAQGGTIMPPPPVPVKAVPKTPSHRKAAIVPFIDGDASVLSTPKSSFTVFRDETEEPSSTMTPSVTDSVMKVKRSTPSENPGLGTGVEPSTEAEALRKDPLKNYAPEERGGEEA
ncbi:hypothetical protein PUNSTDRAFT_103155 [Punctularia strigosozonata HHB-11173 SS5]|uniref:uncharacterized protein n=1 Tax=Punctularia strigosozonata (strain HHB-11173) TaxID=741275 RepID=UPI00044162B4|nr:uncharacterized protein PUNSTDRAFT_103155 [Punctularia strigosozonata HHB-11173 SS5]EIN08337.1 hypothetical protein PUNSTDRAFT_103155 [Punctularia strigosozonata HHB-11173 SS5]